MLAYRPGKWVVGLMSLCIVAVVHAGPTASTQCNDILLATSCYDILNDSSSPVALEIEHISGVDNSCLADIGAKLLEPPVDSPLSATSSLPAGTTSLPPIPGALFMTLAGFLCVSLVRDRKVWTAALVGLLWAGQVGVAALPQLARHLAGGRHTEQLYSPNLTCTAASDDLDRLRSDIQGTTYIGLLHYLAGIPRSKPLPMGILSLRAERSNLKNQRDTRYAIRDTSEAPQFALTEALAYIVPATKRLVPRAKWHVYFSPAFIFSLLARGPPASA